MADEFYLDKSAYDAIMTGLQDVAHEIGADFTKLSDVLVHYDGAWGNDDIGKAFATKYLGEKDKGGVLSDLPALAGVEQNMVESGDIGKKNARNFSEVDKETAKEMDLQ